MSRLQRDVNLEVGNQTAVEWLSRQGSVEPREIEKATHDSAMWFCEVDGRPSVAKLFPGSLVARADVEYAIASGGFHPSIVPATARVTCADGELLVLDFVEGWNLGEIDAFKRFTALSVDARIEALIVVADALGSIFSAGYTVVDWYHSNMIYDFTRGQIWLFDWELCRPGSSFRLEMDSNYGSSRYMAPEEFLRGSLIDESTLVFNVARFALLHVPELATIIPDTLAFATFPAQSGRMRRLSELSGALAARTDRTSP